MPQQADYLECLHGTKQASCTIHLPLCRKSDSIFKAVRDLQINAELQKQLAHKKNDERKAADILPGASIGGTGLIKKDEAA